MVAGGLGVGEGEAAVDLEGLSGLVAAVGLDESVVDPLCFQPGEEEVAKSVGADGLGEAGGLVVAGEDGSDAAGAVGPAPGRLEQVGTAGVAALIDVEGEGLFERRREGDDPILAAFAVLDADAAVVEVDVVEADGDQLGDAGRRCRAGS